MKIKNKLSHQGLVEVDEKTADDLKIIFEEEVIIKHGLSTKGYFIGKTLLGKMLLENEEAAGILISFGMNKTIEQGGQIHLVVEPASGIEKDDVPNVISYLDKFATVAEIGPSGPADGGLPMIKPTPPHS
jgi:hypothetical protein